MIAPEAYKVKCPKCGFSRMVKQRSDVLDVGAMLIHCPTCKVALETVELGALEKIFAKFM